MSHLSYDVCRDDPLPPGDGPNLTAFRHRHDTVKILKLLSIPQEDDLSNDSTGAGEGGLHAHVFQARIRRTSYALKVFKFQSIDDLRRDNFPFSNFRVKDDACIVFQSDPFFAECRAYGRIEEYYQKCRKTRKTRRPEHIATPCLGFMDLPADPFEQIFRTQFGITEWNRPVSDRKLPVGYRQPFRVLVKELVVDKPAIKNPPKMLRDLRTLQKIGVIPGDIAQRNYLDGLFVDFSLSCTLPHWVDFAIPKRWLEGIKKDDLFNFDDMLQESGLEIGWRVRATRNWDFIRRLRPRKKR